MKRFLTSMKEADIRNILAVIIVLGAFFLNVIMMLKPIPHENHDIVITSVSFTLGGALAGVVGYYYGSTKASKKEIAESEKPAT